MSMSVALNNIQSVDRGEDEKVRNLFNGIKQRWELPPSFNLELFPVRGESKFAPSPLDKILVPLQQQKQQQLLLLTLLKIHSSIVERPLPLSGHITGTYNVNWLNMAE